MTTTEGTTPVATETQQQDNQPTTTEIVPVSLDAAAFAAVAPAAAPAQPAATPAADKAAAPAAGDAPAATTDAPADAAPITETTSIKDLAKLNLDELLMTEGKKPEAAAKPAEGAEPKPEGEISEADKELAGIKTPSIPKPRFDEVNNKAKTLEEENEKLALENARLRGFAEGVTSKGTTSTPETTKDPIAEIESDLATLNSDKDLAIINIAKEFDEGKITMVEAEQRKAAVFKNVDAIKAVLNTRLEEAKSVPQQPIEEIHRTVNSDPRLQQATAKLVADNPWLNAVPPEATELLKQIATQEMVKAGIPNVPTVESTWQLRQRIAMVGQRLGYDKLQVQATTPAKATPPAPAVTPEQRKEKLDLAAAHPPAPGVGGTTALGTDAIGAVVNDQSVSVRDLAKTLPKDTLERVLGLTG